MTFQEAISTVELVLKSTGTSISVGNYDGLIVKKLESSNTLDEGRSTHQSHIAITGDQMDIFPYIRSDGYFMSDDSELKKYFIAQIPVKLYESNIRYLLGEQSSPIYFQHGIRETFTSVVRSKRAAQADQIQVSMLNLDGPDFVAFRRMVHTGSFLIILKVKSAFKYEAFGVKDSDGGSLVALNNTFYKIATNTAVRVGAAYAPYFDTAERISTGKNVLLYGVPGSGKSWTIEHEYVKPTSKVERLVFHPDYTYSDFVGQILPCVDDVGQVSYEFTPGPFTNILRDAYQNPKEEFILVIEEINRGNAPAIFGEIFQLLDRKVDDDGSSNSYPIGTSEYGITNTNIATVVYGDSKHKVRIPSNLSIIGTMNTSDQNVFTLDTAFQRRWQMRLIENTFENVDPSFANMPILDTTVTWEKFCTEINKIIIGNGARTTSSEDKRLGAYFIHKSDLKFDDRMGDLKAGIYDTLRKKESAKTITEEEKEQLATIRFAMMQNRRFPEKVIKYLWDDAFKFNREAVFDVGTYQSLEDVIRAFLYFVGRDRMNIFSDSVRGAIFNTEA